MEIEEKKTHIHTKPKESAKRLGLIMFTAFIALIIVMMIVGKFMGGNTKPPAAPRPAPSAWVQPAHAAGIHQQV